VADTFDAMMTDRPYRKAFSLRKVKDEISACSGTQFDPLVAGALLDMLNSNEEEILAKAGYTANAAAQAV
jgi:polar amino acid transport system substrate-binding protein